LNHESIKALLTPLKEQKNNSKRFFSDVEIGFASLRKIAKELDIKIRINSK